MEEKTPEQIRQEMELEIAKSQKQENNLPTMQKDNETSAMLKEKKKQVLAGEQAGQIANTIATEDVKTDFADAAAKINAKNAATAEKEFDTKTRQRRLERLNAELDLQHKYNMSMIKQNGEHKQMLDKKKKMVEKYGYLYDWKDPTKAIDGEGNEYNVPKDFSYSNGVNRFRQFGRNVSKLDRPILQTIKWIAIIGVIVLGVFVLKWTGVIG